jgi:hypothetical protein
MTAASPDGSRPAGLTQLTKDRFEVASKSMAIVGGIVSAAVLIVTLQGTLEQRAREHRWNQARLAMELVDDLMSDPLAFDALRMIDWESREYQIAGGPPQVITSSVVREALDPGNNEHLTATGVYVRESFDRLFHHLGKLERALRSELIVPDDIESPLATYYAPLLRSKYASVIEAYMKQLGVTDAAALLRRYTR